MKSLSVALLATLWVSDQLIIPEGPVYITLRLQEILTYSNTFLMGPRFSRSTKWMITANRLFILQSSEVE